MLVTATDRQGLLRDIGEALARERINVTAVRTQSRDELAHMRFSFEVADVAHLKRALRRGASRCRRDPRRAGLRAAESCKICSL